ncbi:MAG: DUF2079 domain-containing protein, partial [Lachnospiraceae bacterium]|nr:DUF2079 domain-containing protein [Lachnospiraceae bacterium]
KNLGGEYGLEQVSARRVILISCLVMLLQAVIIYLFKRKDKDIAPFQRIGIFAAFCCLSFFGLISSFSWAYFAACCLGLVIFAIYAAKGYDAAGLDRAGCSEIKQALCGKRRGERFAFAAALIMAAAFFAFISLWTVMRVKSLSTPTYDFGIFAQMFHNMRSGGLPMTTLERDGLMPHFFVHVSPVYYILLPFYMIFPLPETLQIAQAAVMASAAVPLYLICKRCGMRPAAIVMICGAFLLYPAFAGGAAYDIHENCFLTPLILWTFYGLESGRASCLYTAAILTLTVKEDAAVYIAVIGLYAAVKGLIIKDRNGLRKGAVLFAVSAVWFICVTRFLALAGDGVMTNRYENLMPGGAGSLLSVIKALITHPMKVLYECIDTEKLAFIGFTLLPLLGLPLMTRKYERYILLIPYVLVNLMPDYTYQHDIFFQYTFGSLAFLFYLTVINLQDLKDRNVKHALCTVSLIACAVLFFTSVVPKARYYTEKYADSREYYDEARELLSDIPEEASAAATSFLTVYLSKREVLYDIKHASRDHVLSCEYIILSPDDASSYKKYASGGEDGFECFKSMLEANGYHEVKRLNDSLIIYRR